MWPHVIEFAGQIGLVASDGTFLRCLFAQAFAFTLLVHDVNALCLLLYHTVN